MEKKQNKVVAFVKEHKAEIVIGAVSAVLGGTIAWTLEKCWIKSEYGKLFELCGQFGRDLDGKPFTKTLTEFLNGATGSIHPMVPSEKIIVSNLGEGMTKLLAEKYGVKATTEVSGILLGLKK